MSKRHKKQKQKLPWVILAIGGAMLVSAAFLFARQGGGDDGGGTPPSQWINSRLIMAM